MFLGGIIVDGAEQQGKSTLCEKLGKMLNYPVYHFGPPPDGFDFFDDYFKPLENASKPTIFDRSYTSELVYGTYFDRCHIDLDRQFEIESRLLELGFIFVLSELSIPWINREETVNRKQNREIKKMYRKMYNTVTIPKLIVTPDQKGIKQIIDLHTKIKNGATNEK